MRLTLLLGVIYLAILKLTHGHHRTPAVRVQRASIVWGSLVPQKEEST